MASTFKHLFFLVSIFFLIPLTLSAAIETSNTHYDITQKNNGLGEEEKMFKVFKSKLKFVYGHYNQETSPKKGDVAYAYDQLDQGQFENDDNRKTLQKADDKSDEVACDSYNSCPSKTTCCCTYTYGPYCLSWGCCPFEAGVCCADDPSQCCPQKHPICDTHNGTCKKKKHSQFSSKALKLTLV